MGTVIKYPRLQSVDDQRVIEDPKQSKNFSQILLKPGDVVAMESGYAIPHQSNKRSLKKTSAEVDDYNAVLVYYMRRGPLVADI